MKFFKNKDTARIILNFVDSDAEFLNLRLLDKWTNSLYDEFLFFNRIKKWHPGWKTEENWKLYFLRQLYYIKKLKEDNDIIYKDHELNYINYRFNQSLFLYNKSLKPPEEIYKKSRKMKRCKHIYVRGKYVGERCSYYSYEENFCKDHQKVLRNQLFSK